MSDWRAHPLCGPADTMPERFWGPEPFEPSAWRELEPLFEPTAEIAAILDALGDATDCVDVGGGTGLITQSIAQRMPVLVIEPSGEQRTHLPHGIAQRAGRIEAIPLHDRAYDAAVATWVLQYTDDPLKALSELVRVARRRVVIVQGAPGNELIEVWNLEAQVAGIRQAHHGWLLSRAAEMLERAGFAISMQRVSIPVPCPKGAHFLADAFARLHFTGHAKLAEMIAITEPAIARMIAAKGFVTDDAVVLRAFRD